MNGNRDFFISYTEHDKQWAEWIAWQLESNGYTTVIQVWDFKPGGNFVSNMHKALISCKRFIAVISPNYFKSLYCQSEWTAAFTKDPSCERALFIPVRIADFQPEGLFAPIIYIDLYGVNEDEAVKRLLDGVSTSDRPKNRPGFPGTADKPKFPGQLPFNNLPFTKNPNFTGREAILDRMRNLFEQGQYISLTQSVVGLGGVGKTQVVLEYAFRYGYLYDTIWWVKADSPQTLLRGYADFSHKNKLLQEIIHEKDLILEAVWNWMLQHKNWLFIYDNAEHPKIINDYLPRNNTGHILITSRYKDWSWFGQTIPVDVFTPEEASAFLIQRTGIYDKMNAARLGEELGYLPLALEQAAAYIIQNKTTYEKYLELYKKYKLRMFQDKDFKPRDYYCTVAVTWDITIDKIRTKSARQFLYIRSFFAPDDMDRNIFVNCQKRLPQPLAGEGLDELQFNKIISQLAQYSLITVHSNTISMHRLLQEAVRQSVDKKEWLHYCLQMMSGIVFDYYDMDTWNSFSNLVPHALSVADRAKEADLYLKGAAMLYNKVGEWLIHIAMYSEADSSFRKALAIVEEVLEKEHPETAGTYHNMGLVNYHQGNYAEALEWYQRAKTIHERVSGAEHPETAATYNNIAEAYGSQGKYTEALEWHQRAKAISEKALGAEHPLTATIYNNIAGVYDKQGNYAEALGWYQNAKIIREKALGAEHPETAAIYNNIAAVCNRQGRYAEALEWYQRAKTIYEKVLGEDHPDTAAAYNNIAEAYGSQEKYTEALEWHQRARTIYEKVLGAEHPNMAASYNNIAGVYNRQGKYAEVLECYQRAKIIREKALGVEHPSTATIYNNIAGVYSRQGRYAEALEWYQKALAIREKVLGEDHPDTAVTYNNIGLVNYSQENYAESLGWYQKALRIYMSKQMLDSPTVKIIKGNLRSAYISSGGKEDDFETWLENIISSDRLR